MHGVMGDSWTISNDLYHKKTKSFTTSLMQNDLCVKPFMFVQLCGKDLLSFVNEKI